MTAKKAVPSLSDLVAPQEVEEEVTPEVESEEDNADLEFDRDEDYVDEEEETGFKGGIHGNGVTDNKPVGWDDNSPSGTVTRLDF